MHENDVLLYINGLIDVLTVPGLGASFTAWSLLYIKIYSAVCLFWHSIC